MSTLMDKLTALEEQINSLRSKVGQFSTRSENLANLAKNLAEQVHNVDQEATALGEDVSQTRSELDSLLSLLGEVRAEGLQAKTKEDENRLLHETLTSMFGETFQVVSRFLETAKKLGVVEEESAAKILEAAETGPSVKEEPVVDEPVVETSEPVVSEPVVEEPEPAVEASEPVATESVTVEPITEAVSSFGDLTDADFVQPASSQDDVAGLSLPSLPDVLTSPESLPEADPEEPPDTVTDMASQLDLPPLQLDMPALPDTDLSTDEEQKIEDLLTDLSKPIST